MSSSVWLIEAVCSVRSGPGTERSIAGPREQHAAGARQDGEWWPGAARICRPERLWGVVHGQATRWSDRHKPQQRIERFLTGRLSISYGDREDAMDKLCA